MLLHFIFHTFCVMPHFVLQVPGAVLLRESVAVREKKSCPPGFQLSGTSCAHVEDDLAHMIGVVFGCIIAAFFVVILSFILFKMRRRRLAVPKEEFDVTGYDALAVKDKGHWYARFRSPAEKLEENYDIIPDRSLCFVLFECA
ncbi:uncharacterized protein LOC112568643 [Pomacea canaliculata]|uniref:uncharacterized protein LOC112568643 n=1 Tax=Pomacea canaliculata TaxID=400727 RepID=UPI000D728DBB|nr:uncharacterized protein LOC112568643 [Pomacea canaliculata]